MPVAQSTYLLASTAVGLAQVVDAVLLVKYQDTGRLRGFTTIFSFGEYIWAGVSLLVWRSALEPFPHWLPASFIAYVAAFFAAGLVIAVQQRGKDMKIPLHLAVAGGCFGAYFALASMLHLGDASEETHRNAK